MIRWKGIIVLVVIVALVFVASIFLTDKFVERKLEDIGTSIVGAKVEIDNLDVNIFTLLFSWERIQITDPQNTMTNMAELGVCEFDMEFLPLLSGKYIIEDFVINDLRTGTPRETDGVIPKKEESEDKEPGFISKTATKLKNDVESNVNSEIGDFKTNLNIDSLLSKAGIESVEKIDSLKENIIKKYENIEKQIDEIDIEKDINYVDKKVNSIDVNNINTLPKLKKNLEAVKDATKQVVKTKAQITMLKRDLQNGIKETKTDVSKVQNWVKDDYKRAKKLAKLPEINIDNIGKMLFGNKIVNQYYKYLGYIAKYREFSEKYLPEKKEKEPEPPRMEGQNIYFSNKYGRPKFWLKNLNLSGETKDKLSLSGSLTNLVSDQKFINKTTNFDVGGIKDNRKLNFEGELNHLGEKPKETFKINYSGFSLKDMKLSDSKLFPNKFDKGTGELKVGLRLKGNEINSAVLFKANDIKFNFVNSEKELSKYEAIVQNTIRDVDNFYIQAQIVGKKDDLQFKVKSNLDDILVANLKKEMGKEIDKLKKKIEDKIDEEVAKYKEKLDIIIAEKEKILKDKI
ncbi:MAG: TIGR03545 family protein, partial [Candidatus Marinimicrobia bacterium]|nr:TIGR03545 family protein [Candidatus Neomarinimicrobiota bacterium]